MRMVSRYKARHLLKLTLVAEDFHGNDYPEDEVESEDEHGRGAYGYRHRASDDEQFENDDSMWSDEECTYQSPWK